MWPHLHGPELHLPPPTHTAPRALGPDVPAPLELLDDGGRLRLVRGAREVGWLGHRVIGFRGFPDADAARAAASAAYSTLSRWLARQSRTRPVPARRRPLSCRHDGVSELLTLGGVPVGRLCRFTAADAADRITDVGFELFLRARVTDSLQLRAACVVERALRAPSLTGAAGRRADREPQPPRAERPTLHLVADGDGTFRLTRGGWTAAWIRGASIRVGAFATELDAMRAALRGARALDDYVDRGMRRATGERMAAAGDARETRGARTAAHRSPREEDREGWPPATRTLTLEASDGGRALGDTTGDSSRDLRLVHDGAYEWIVRGVRPIARLIRPERRGATSESSTAAFGLEFVAPSVVPSILRVTLARMLVRAVDASSRDRSAHVTPSERRDRDVRGRGDEQSERLVVGARGSVSAPSA